MGAHFNIPIMKMDWNTIQAKTRNTKMWAADALDGLPYDEVNWQDDAALVIGGEAAGAGPKTRNIATPIHIPMQSNTESLNAAIACGVILFEAVRQRRAKGK